MSLILEALRKSEAERRRGATPSVYSELPPVATSTAARPDWRWIAGLATAVLLATALWFARGAVVRPPSDAATATAPVDREPEARTPALRPVSHLTASAPKPASPAAKASTPTAAPADAPTSRSTPVPVADVISRTVPAIATPRAPTIPASPSATAPVDAMQSLSDLSPDARKELPPLKISMHMWNADPAQRFVIIDGTRLREGDRIGDAVLTAIVTDGVVLDWNGRRLKLPIR